MDELDRRDAIFAHLAGEIAELTRIVAQLRPTKPQEPLRQVARNARPLSGRKERT